jgi:transcriptional regulator
MYIPEAFRVDHVEKLHALMQKHPFATLITQDGGMPFASHVPMLLRPSVGPHGTLISHMARANPQWHHFASGQEALAIFHGPHAYISPSWYQTQPAVPTWNYALVHARGVPRLLQDHSVIAAILRETVSTFEAPHPRPWAGDLPSDYFDRMIQGVVAFEIPIRAIEGKFKLGQNRSPEDLRGVQEALARSTNREDQALAEFMVEECPSLRTP